VKGALSAVGLVVGLSIVFLVAFQNDSIAQVREESPEISKQDRIVINSDTLEVDQQKRLIVFEGKVRARRRDMTVDCQKMLVYYLDRSASTESDVESRQIDKIIALGNVTVNRSDGSVARAGKAVFFQAEEKIVLTEDPSVQQGRDIVKGEKIIILLKQERSIVEGSKEKPVRATLFPKQEEGGQ
jgi:lipopolysaccharide export system protein LptA